MSDTWTFKDIARLLFVSLITVGLLGQLGDTVYRGECRSEGYFKAVLHNSRLKDYVISTQDVHALEDCIVACLSDEHCSSYNFQVSGDPLHMCELNFKSRSSARPGSLVLEEGYQYYEAIDSVETQDLCESAGCQNGASCKENCETLSSQHVLCQCSSSFTGEFCERPKNGNFLLNYNSSTMDDHISVSVTGKDFDYLAVCVWVKPAISSGGVLFSYATQANPWEILLLFDELIINLFLRNYSVGLVGGLPRETWSHLCFTLSDKTKVKLYYNGLLRETHELPSEVTIEGTGILIPAFEQVSPGQVDRTTGTHLTLTRLYIFDTYRLEEFDVLRLFNEPDFAMVSSKPFRVDWKEFYQPNSDSSISALVKSSDQPDLGNYDLRYPLSTSINNTGVVINIPHMPPVYTFVLSMWLKITGTSDHFASIFKLRDAGNNMIFRLAQQSSNGFKTFLMPSYENSFDYVISDTRWFHLLVYWNNSTGKLFLYKNGNQMYEIPDVLLNGSLPELHHGSARILGSAYVGAITGLNMWTMAFSLDMIVTLALNPGNAAGNLVSWKSVENEGYSIDHSPSQCHDRQGQFDLMFSKVGSQMNYIYMESTRTSNFNSISAAFWIKISSSAAEFTLISYAVPSQVNEFNVHFGITGIWVNLHDNQRFIPLKRSSLVGEWRHFIISYSPVSSHLFVHHNGEQIFKEAVSTKSIVGKDGVLVVGVRQNDYKQVNEAQFIGELSQLQIYRRLFTAGMIRMFSSRCWNIPGNFFQWADMRLNVKGHVGIRNPSQCVKVKNGETS